MLCHLPYLYRLIVAGGVSRWAHTPSRERVCCYLRQSPIRARYVGASGEQWCGYSQTEAKNCSTGTANPGTICEGSSAFPR